MAVDESDHKIYASLICAGKVDELEGVIQMDAPVGMAGQLYDGMARRYSAASVFASSVRSRRGRYSILRKVLPDLYAAGIRHFHIDATDNCLEKRPLPGDSSAPGGRASPFVYTFVKEIISLVPEDAVFEVHLLLDNIVPGVARSYARRGIHEVTFPLNAFEANLAGLETVLNKAKSNGRPLRPGISLPHHMGADRLDSQVVRAADYVLVRCMQGIVPDSGYDVPEAPQGVDRAVDRVAEVREFLDAQDMPDTEVRVVGGVTPDNMERFARAGARGFVVGTALFGSRNGSCDYAGFMRSARRALSR